MRILHRLFLSGFIAVTALPALATVPPTSVDGLGIAVIVNDDIITSADLGARLRFIFATTGMNDTQEARARLTPQIIRQLADETLQMQEAERQKITVSDQEVTKAIASIEQQRGIPAGGLLRRLKDLGVPEDTFRRQLRAQIAWSQISNKEIRSRIRISEEEVERAQMRPQEEPSKGVTADEVKISVFALPVEKPAQEAQMRALAEKLVTEIRGGIAFETVARELAAASSGGSAATAPFWIAPSQLDPLIAGALEKTTEGGITPPIRTASGYSIVHLLERKGSRSLDNIPDSEVLIKDVLLKLKNNAAPREVKVMMQIGRDVSKNPGTCLQEGIAGVGNVDDYDISVMFRRVRNSEMTEAVRGLLKGVAVGGVTQPFATPEGIRFLMLCERMDAAPKMASREETHSRLMQEKMELEVQKYMRNLRREAYIEIKI